MSSDFYFRKWRTTLVRLKEIVNLDLHLQETKVHDKTSCEAVLRLTQVLVQYMAMYNDALDALKQNLQMQKTEFMKEIIKTIVSRILELKRELRKLEASECHFLSNGLIINKLTIDDAELADVPSKLERDGYIQRAMEEVMERAKVKRELLIQKDDDVISSVEPKTIVHNWWDADYSESESLETNEHDEESVISAESLKRRGMIDLIKAQEKSRQVLCSLIKQRSKRERWEKILKGNAIAHAPYEKRKKAAELIQKIVRAYFEIKRQELKERQRDEILGIAMRKHPCNTPLEKAKEIETRREGLKKKYEETWKCYKEEIKRNFLTQRIDDIAEYYRDFIRNWLMEWFEEIKFFHDLPNVRDGGSVLIISEDIQTPVEWMEEYEKAKAQKIANKGKTVHEIKFEKRSAKREEMRVKKQKAMQKKKETDLIIKMMKNPEMHPGFTYPESRKARHILDSLAHYDSIWNDLDRTGAIEAKEQSVKEMDMSNACAQAKLEAVAHADKDMRLELKLLKAALKRDYLSNGEEILESMKTKRKPASKKIHKINMKITQNILVQLEDLAVKGFVKVYPKIKLQDFLGDPNFTGEEFRCDYKAAYPFNGEIRYMWWDRCRELSHGFHKILLVGPRGNGKTNLVHALANHNDAVLFELDLSLIRNEMIIAPYMKLITDAIATCAKAFQPSVIHIKHVQRLFYKKVPPTEADFNLNIANRFWIKELFKKIHKTDHITIIGTCVDPWLTKSKRLLKAFPAVLLLPNTSYSTIIHLLQNWILKHTIIPADLDVHSLGYVLQEYSYGYLMRTLEEFMTPERTVKVAVYGLKSEEVYDYIIDNQTELNTEYTKYLKWYTDKTHCGKREQKHIEDQRNFKQLMLELELKKKKYAVLSSVQSSAHQMTNY